MEEISVKTMVSHNIYPIITVIFSGSNFSFVIDSIKFW